MRHLTLVRTLHSKVDKTRKLIYTLNRDNGPTTIEIGVIDKGDGKDILCVPTQTNCAQACRFCHTTQMAGKVAVSDLSAAEMSGIVRAAWLDAEIDLAHPNRPLLVSFMGVGEPLANRGLVDAMIQMGRWAQDQDTRIRFGLATMLPEKYLGEFTSLTGAVNAFNLPLKVHLSLHYPTTAQRREWMPTSASVGDSLAALAKYHRETRNPVEIHYTLIAGVNDAIDQIYELGKLAAYHGGAHNPLPVKFLKLNPLPGDVHHGPDNGWVAILREHIERYWSVKTEYYESPGADIAASCGMFMTDAYIPAMVQQIEPMEKFGPTQVELPADTFSQALRIHSIVSAPQLPAEGV